MIYKYDFQYYESYRSDRNWKMKGAGLFNFIRDMIRILDKAQEGKYILNLYINDEDEVQSHYPWQEY